MKQYRGSSNACCMWKMPRCCPALLAFVQDRHAGCARIHNGWKGMEHAATRIATLLMEKCGSCILHTDPAKRM